LGNTLTWGEQQIPEPADEFVDIQEIYYYKKRKYIMRRTTKKRRLTLDSSILIIMEETLLNTKHTKTYELISIGMVITDATLDRAKRDEKDLTVALKDLEQLHHLEKYYQDSMQTTIFLKSEFQDAYAKFTNKRHLFTAGIVDFQKIPLWHWKPARTCRDGMRIHTKWYNELTTSAQYRRVET
jgi:hypothetical protein